VLGGGSRFCFSPVFGRQRDHFFSALRPPPCPLFPLFFFVPLKQPRNFRPTLSTSSIGAVFMAPCGFLSSAEFCTILVRMRSAPGAFSASFPFTSPSPRETRPLPVVTVSCQPCKFLTALLPHLFLCLDGVSIVFFLSCSQFLSDVSSLSAPLLTFLFLLLFVPSFFSLLNVLLLTGRFFKNACAPPFPLIPPFFDRSAPGGPTTSFSLPSPILTS